MVCLKLQVEMDYSYSERNNPSPFESIVAIIFIKTNHFFLEDLESLL